MTPRYMTKLRNALRRFGIENGLAAALKHCEARDVDWCVKHDQQAALTLVGYGGKVRRRLCWTAVDERLPQDSCDVVRGVVIV